MSLGSQYSFQTENNFLLQSCRYARNFAKKLYLLTILSDNGRTGSIFILVILIFSFFLDDEDILEENKHDSDASSQPDGIYCFIAAYYYSYLSNWFLDESEVDKNGSTAEIEGNLYYVGAIQVFKY